MSRANRFLLALVAFLAGVAAPGIFSLPWFSAWLVGSLAFVGLWWRGRGLIIVWVAVGLAFGLIRAGSAPKLGLLPEGYKNLTGIIRSTPDARRDRVQYIVDVADAPASAGFLLVKAPLEPKYQTGDRISFRCALKKPEPIETFAYDRYLALAGVVSVCQAPSVTLVASGRPSLTRSLDQARSFVIQRLNRLLPEPEASFAAGILIGARRGLPPGLVELFQRTGTSHLVALSGFNITIVTQVILSVLCRIIGRRRAWPLTIIGISMFVVFVGSQPSIVRAGIMGSVAGLASMVGRPSGAGRAIVLSAAAMVFVQPAILLDDVSFQLSVAATTGLVVLQPLIEGRLGFIPERFGIRGIVGSTMAATVATLPIVGATFGRLSLVALPVNVLILPLVPLGMATAVVGLVGGFLGQAAGLVLMLPAWLCLHIVVLVVGFFGSPGWAALELPEIGPTAFLLYLPMSLIVWRLVKRRKAR